MQRSGPGALPPAFPFAGGCMAARSPCTALSATMSTVWRVVRRTQSPSPASPTKIRWPCTPPLCLLYQLPTGGSCFALLYPGGQRRGESPSFLCRLPLRLFCRRELGADARAGGNAVPLQSEFFPGTLLLERPQSCYADLVTDGVPILRLGFAGFPYLAIWVKEKPARFVCIEPWHGLPDG